MVRGCRGGGEASEAGLGYECCIITLSAPTVRSFYGFLMQIFKLTTFLFEVFNFMVTIQSWLMVVFLFKVTSFVQMLPQAVLRILFKHTIYTHTAL